MIPIPSEVALAQAVFFFQRGGDIVPHALYRRLPDPFLSRFDGEPTFLPSVNGAPEIPLLILRSRSGDETLTLSSVRVDLRQTPLPSAQNLSLSTFFETSITLLQTVQDAASRQVERLAAVVQRYVACDNPGLALAEQFCKDRLITSGPLNRPESFELHAHKKYALGSGVVVNSWVRNKTATTTSTGAPIVVVEQDINTLENQDAISADTVRSFFVGISAELDSVLRLYYPPITTEGG